MLFKRAEVNPFVFELDSSKKVFELINFYLSEFGEDLHVNEEDPKCDEVIKVMGDFLKFIPVYLFLDSEKVNNAFQIQRKYDNRCIVHNSFVNSNDELSRSYYITSDCYTIFKYNWIDDLKYITELLPEHIEELSFVVDADINTILYLITNHNLIWYENDIVLDKLTFITPPYLPLTEGEYIYDEENTTFINISNDIKYPPFNKAIFNFLAAHHVYEDMFVDVSNTYINIEYLSFVLPYTLNRSFIISGTRSEFEKIANVNEDKSTCYSKSIFKQIRDYVYTE